jgi:peptide/nickel transport system permease protein
MGQYLIRRCLAAIPVFIGVTTLTYLTMAASAGDYVPGITLDSNLRPGDVERLRANLGLDRPLWLQYITWLLGVLHGDFGRSMTDNLPIIGLLLERLPNTLLLSATALAFGIVLGTIFGVLGALNRGRTLDKIFSAIAVTGYASPQFWLGLVLILAFVVAPRSWGMPGLPAAGAYDSSVGGDLADRLAHLVLPAATLSFLYVSIWSRFVRSSMISVLAQDFVRTARSKGLPERRVVFLHALRNALMPLVTLVGLEIPRLVSGSLVVEVIFDWPGIGRLAFDRASQYDYTAVLGVTAFVAVMVILGSLIADLLYGVLDPRIRLQ